MTYRKPKPTWAELAGYALAVVAVVLIQVFVIWVSFNMLGRAFSWPRINFLQAGALYFLTHALLNLSVTTKKE